MKILLHICCASCAIYIQSRLKDKAIETAGFFYNPNIQPSSEYALRKESVMKLSVNNNIEIVCPPYDIGEYFSNIEDFDDESARCSKCWYLRMKKTAGFAKDNGFDGFTTTLLISPYQDHETIKDICVKLAGEYGIDFYYEDFRSGFRQSHTQARENGFYMQKYCGCIFSEFSRYKSKLEKEAKKCLR